MHSDTSCIGNHALILNDYDRSVTVYRYEPILVSHTFCKVLAIMSYMDHKNVTTYHIVIHKEIEIPHLDHHLFPQCSVD